ncbi:MULTISPECIES: MFS transporter [unclassified Lysobacter]|uniref:MFS transporter n=1 Tax=unclassified Lysobacter TaxID=2635362 RepID=UPI001BEC2AB5|nr:MULTISPECIES: MFS transporter [unclassified Lysobacter]MBT2747297.1 MFS transporter [Lysobacter sp. ISL-42]MBT2753342.1 MFS transporter [Lysobacter sp. ISL-50]MBT2775452.1 MFS transporter [Lysobacter sp. ISL-54]MBT2783012.1 MFS transporter [Lysobacter sp. ISL-52]
MNAATDTAPDSANTDATEHTSLFAPRYRSLTTGAVALVALVAFEALAITTAMPTVARALNGLPLYALAFGGTLAASVIGMVAAGRWADARGPSAPLGHGIAWFAVGLIAAGLAPSMGWLIAGRVVQGFGGGLISVALYVVVGRVYPSQLRTKIFAAFAAAWVVPAVVGPAISGAIVEHAGWRWVFLSVPIAAALAATLVLPALRGLGPSAAAGGGPSNGEQSTRLLWALLTTASLLALHYGGQQRGWTAPLWLLPATAALALAASRLLPSGTLRAARGLPTVVTLRGIGSGAFFLTEAYIPLLLSQERALSPTWSGLVLTLGAVGWSCGAWFRGRTTDARKPQRFLQAGMAMVALGIGAVATLIAPQTPLALGIAGWILAGLGMGLFYPTLSVLMLELSPPERQGVNSSALHLGDAIYTATALAIGGSLFAALLSRSHTMAYVCGFAIAMTLALSGWMLAARVRPRA